MPIPRVYVPAPPTTPLPYGLTSVATVLDKTDEPQFQAAGVEYEPASCGPVRATSTACEAQPVDEDGEPVDLTGDDGVPLVSGLPFVLYHLFSCRPLGGVLQDAEERAVASFRLGESRGIEAGLARQFPGLPGAVDLTDGGTVDAVTGLAMLERFAADNYGGVPVVHIDRGIGTVLTASGAVVRSGTGTNLETVQGALVASGGGYSGLRGPLADVDDEDSAVVAPAGARWLYVTGQVVVTRAPDVRVQPTMHLTGPGGGALNEFAALVERTVVVTTECITAAVLVSEGPVPS